MTPPSRQPPIFTLLENGKGIQFRIKTSKGEYLCTIQDRASYQRNKAQGLDSSAEATQSQSTTSSAASSNESINESSTAISTTSNIASNNETSNESNTAGGSESEQQ